MKSWLKLIVCCALVCALFVTQVANPCFASVVLLEQPTVPLVSGTADQLAFIRPGSALRGFGKLRRLLAGERTALASGKTLIKETRADAVHAKRDLKAVTAPEKGLEAEIKGWEKGAGSFALGVGRVKVSAATLREAMAHGKSLIALGISVDMARQLYATYNIYKDKQTQAGKPIDPCHPVVIHPDGSDLAFSIYDADSCPVS